MPNHMPSLQRHGRIRPPNTGPVPRQGPVMADQVKDEQAALETELHGGGLQF